MDNDMRTNADEAFDTDSWLRAVGVGFGRSQPLTDEFLPAHRERAADGRLRGMVRGGRFVATMRSFDQRLTVPGGREIAAHAVTAVTVQSPHRRRGLLRTMLTSDLSQAKEEGQPLSTLISMEYPIYQGFGYGPAGVATSRSVLSRASGVPRNWTIPDAAGSLEFTDGAEVRRLGPELYDRVRLQHPGAVDRSAQWWRFATGDLRLSPDWAEPFHVLHRDTDGVVQGLVTYRIEHDWQDGVPNGTVSVQAPLIATGPEAERALWYFLLTLDMAASVDTGRLYPDALLPDLLPDPRAARITAEQDFLWLRPLDVPAMLQSRSYPVEGELVLAVTDPQGFADGRFLLTASPEGAQCAPTSRSADLTLGAGALGTLFLGDRPASRLAAVGLIDEESTGALARADLMLQGSRRVWTPDLF